MNSTALNTTFKEGQEQRIVFPKDGPATIECQWIYSKSYTLPEHGDDRSYDYRDHRRCSPGRPSENLCLGKGLILTRKALRSIIYFSSALVHMYQAYQPTFKGGRHNGRCTGNNYDQPVNR